MHYCLGTNTSREWKSIQSLLIYFKESLGTSPGWRVVRTARTGDFGADLVLMQGGRRVSVQAKRRDRPVGVTAVQEAVAARLHYGTEDAMVVTNATFTRAARELAGTEGVKLWERSDVARELLGPGRGIAIAVQSRLSVCSKKNLMPHNAIVVVARASRFSAGVKSSGLASESATRR